MNPSSYSITFVVHHPKDEPDDLNPFGLTSTFLNVIVPCDNHAEALRKARRILIESHRTAPVFPSGTCVKIMSMVEVHEVPEEGLILCSHSYGTKGYDITGTLPFPRNIPAGQVSFYGLRHPAGPDTTFWIAPDLG
jgi:hypothetical protein